MKERTLPDCVVRRVVPCQRSPVTPPDNCALNEYGAPPSTHAFWVLGVMGIASGVPPTKLERVGCTGLPPFTREKLKEMKNWWL